MNSVPTLRKTLSFWLFACVALVSVIINSSTAVSSSLLHWTVKLYPQNQEYIEVSVDRTSLRTSSVEDVTFELLCYDSNARVMKRAKYAFTDDELRILAKPVIYRRYFLHSCNGVRSVKGINMKYTLRIIGGGASDESASRKIPVERVEKRTEEKTDDRLIEDKKACVENVDKDCLQVIGRIPTQN